MSILTPSGFKVLTANGVSEGLALARQSSCDLIVSDVCMGGEQRLRLSDRCEVRSSTSAYSFHPDHLNDDETKEIESEGLALGADRFLRRPIEPQVLLDEISECLRQKSRY